MDTATSRSMTALCGVTVYARAEDGVGKPTVSRPPTRPCHSTPSRHFRSTRRTQTSSFLAPAPGLGIPQYPQNPNFVIPCSCSWRRDSAVPAEPKVRHSLLLLLASGFRSTRRTQTSSFRAQSRNPCLASQRISQRSQRHLHSTMDTATSRSMTALCGVAVYARAEDGVGRPTVPRPPTGQRTALVSRRCPVPRHAPVTPHPPVISGIPAEPKLRHSARSRGIHASLANASAREASALCTPLWILRLRAV